MDEIQGLMNTKKDLTTELKIPEAGWSVAQILVGLNNKNSESDIRGWKLRDQRSHVASH